VEHSLLVELCRQKFSKKQGDKKNGVQKTGRLQDSYLANSGARTLHRDVQQATILLGTSGKDTGRDQRFALSLFNVAFGSGMGSRLFQKVREEHGLAYSVYSSLDTHIGCRAFTVSLATDPRKLRKALGLVKAEVQHFLDHGFAPGELERARQNIIGNLRLSEDSVANRQNRMARQILRNGHYTPVRVAEMILHAMTEPRTEELMRSFLTQNPWTITAVLPEDCKEKMEPLAFH
jgi:predicted Zn-dependent peptidase